MTVTSSVCYTLTAYRREPHAGMATINGTGNGLGQRDHRQWRGHVLDGGLGNDALAGGKGNDTFPHGPWDMAPTPFRKRRHGRQHRRTQVPTQHHANQLWFAKAGNDLQISIIGTADKATVQNWYLSAISTTSSSSGVATARCCGEQPGQPGSWCEAMAGFAPPAMGQTALTAAQQTALAPVLAANWQ